MKSLIKKFLRSRGRELICYTPEQQERLARDPGLSYRDLIIEEAFLRTGGEISLQEGRFLAQLIRNLESRGPIVEIGTLFGSSARVMLLEKSPEQEIISVDGYFWNPLNISSDLHYKITRSLLREASDLHHLKLTRIDKNKFFDAYSGPSPALVFCDAVHTYEETKLDIEWAQKVNASIICGHDYDKEKFPGVVKIVDEFGGPKQLVETLWVL